MSDKYRLDWLESITREGACPALVNDDNGHWAVAFTGFQNVPDGLNSETILKWVLCKQFHLQL